MKPNEQTSKTKWFVVFALCATVVFSGVRLVQMLKMIDVETGFYQSALVFNRIFSYAVAAIGLLLTGCCLLKRDETSRVAANLKSAGACVGALLLGLCLLYDAVQAFLFYKSGGDTASMVGTGLQALLTSGRFALLGEAIFAVPSAVYFFLLCADYRKGGQAAAARKLLALSPVAWTAMRLVHHFIIKISFVRVSDLFFELIMLSFMVLFFLAFAQVNSNVYRDGFEWRLFGFGMPAAIIAGMLSLPRLILTVAQPALVNSSYPLRPADLAFCVFLLLYCFALLKQPQAEATPAA